MTTQEKINQLDKGINELYEGYGYTRACNKLFDVLEQYVERGEMTRDVKMDIILQLMNSKDA